MRTVGRLKASVVFHFKCVLAISTTLLCYILAVSFKHVSAWLPMISGCAVRSPEKFFFRYGVLTTALLIVCESVILYFAAVPKSRAALVLGSLAGLCLGVVAVDSEKEASAIHSVAAVSFFILYWGNMVVLSTASLEKVLPCCGHTKSRAPSLKDKFIVTLRQFLTVLCGALLFLAGILAVTVKKSHVPYEAMLEWVGSLSIIIFSWTFVDETSTITIDETRHSRNVSRVNDGYHSLDSDSA